MKRKGRSGEKACLIIVGRMVLLKENLEEKLKPGEAATEGKSELLRGIPDFRQALPSSSSKRGGAVREVVNPVPAGVVKRGSAPKNGHEFARELKRRKTPEEKLAWMFEIPEEAFTGIFRVELDAELLQAILLSMHTALLKAAPKEEDQESGESGQALGKGCRSTLAALCRRCPKALDFAASFQTAQDRKRALELLAEVEKRSAADEGASEDLRAIKAGLLLQEEE